MKLPANELKLRILRALDASKAALDSTEIARRAPHDNAQSVYAAMRPLRAQGLIVAAGRRPQKLRTGGIVFRPLYMITAEGRAWVRRNQTAPARAAKAAADARRTGYDDSGIAAVLEAWR